jgi:hypothetical protein
MRKLLYSLTTLIALLGLAIPPARAADVAGHVLTIYFLEAGIDVKLYDWKNTFRHATVTDQTGLYQFSDVTPGTYHLTITAQWMQPTVTEPFRVSDQSVNNLDYLVRPSTPALLSAMRSLARWNPEVFVSVVDQHKDWFVGNNEICTCADTLSSRLTKAALSMASPAQNYQDALNIASKYPIPPETAKLVANNMSATLGNTLVMAQDMSELSVSIRGLTSGDLTPYKSTQLYRSIAAARSLLAQWEQISPQVAQLETTLMVVTETIVFQFTFPSALAVCG